MAEPAADSADHGRDGLGVRAALPPHAAPALRRRAHPRLQDDPLLGGDPARLLRRLHLLLDHRARGPHHPEPLGGFGAARDRSGARQRAGIHGRHLRSRRPDRQHVSPRLQEPRDRECVPPALMRVSRDLPESLYRSLAPQPPLPARPRAAGHPQGADRLGRALRPGARVTRVREGARPASHRRLSQDRARGDRGGTALEDDEARGGRLPPFQGAVRPLLEAGRQGAVPDPVLHRRTSGHLGPGHAGARPVAEEERLPRRSGAGVPAGSYGHRHRHVPLGQEPLEAHHPYQRGSADPEGPQDPPPAQGIPALPRSQQLAAAARGAAPHGTRGPDRQRPPPAHSPVPAGGHRGARAHRARATPPPVPHPAHRIAARAAPAAQSPRPRTLLTRGDCGYRGRESRVSAMSVILSRTAHGRLSPAVLVLALSLPCVPAVADAPPPAATPAGGTAALLEIHGPIGPATSRYVVRGLEAARHDGSRLVVLELDTPGGLDSAMRDIIQAILASPVPLEQKVIDVIARDLPELLARIDGREVRIDDRTVKLATRELTVVRVKPDWRTQLLAVITNPTVAYGLMLIGIWGLLLEGYNPGAVLPGVAGSICLLIALFAFQILSVNYAGLALVVLGTGMIISEFFFPTYGSLGIGGLIAFVVGSLILFDTDVPGMSVGRPMIGAYATVGGLMIAGIVYLATRSMRRPVATGTQSMIGETAEVVADFTGRGRVRYGGELWNARSDTALRSGDLARIVKVEGLTLWVEPTARAP